MNYTEKHHLPQWDESDRILMEDFNQAMANIEEGLTEKSYYTGGYTGTGTNWHYNLGFRPSFVIVSCEMSGSDITFVGWTGIAGKMQTSKSSIIIDDTGFSLPAYNEERIYPRVNTPGCGYSFIAFR